MVSMLSLMSIFDVVPGQARQVSADDQLAIALFDLDRRQPQTLLCRRSGERPASAEAEVAEESIHLLAERSHQKTDS
jgi:hypothetical protein